LPSWLAIDSTLTFYLIFDSRTEIPADGDEIADALFKRFKPTGPFKHFTFRLVALSELSAEAYVSSEPLDLEHLSHSQSQVRRRPGSNRSAVRRWPIFGLRRGTVSEAPWVGVANVRARDLTIVAEMKAICDEFEAFGVLTPNSVIVALS
jgi:hypothetical protein